MISLRARITPQWSPAWRRDGQSSRDQLRKLASSAFGFFLIVVTFLESTRFITPLIPGLSPVQGAALREFLISVSLIVILRFRSQGILPESPSHPVVPAAKAGAETQPAQI